MPAETRPPAPACSRCRHPLGADVPAWRDQLSGGDICLPCAMDLVLPGRDAVHGAGASPRYSVPRVLAEAVRAELDLGTGETWPVDIEEFSAEGVRLRAPVPFGAGTPAVIVLRDRGGQLDPAVFAVEVRWVRSVADGPSTIGTRVIASVDGHHTAFLTRVLARVAQQRR